MKAVFLAFFPNLLYHIIVVGNVWLGEMYCENFYKRTVCIAPYAGLGAQ